MTRRNKERLVFGPLCLIAVALAFAGTSGRFGDGFARYSMASWVVVGMISGQLIRTFLPQRMRDAQPKDAIAQGTAVAILLIGYLVVLCLVGVVGAALR